MAADLEAEGIALYAISYDPPDVLAGFAERHGISYPLLSDAGGGPIRELGILNEEAGERVEGVPHPGVFVLGFVVSECSARATSKAGAAGEGAGLHSPRQ